MEQRTTVIPESDLRHQREICQMIKEYWQARGITPKAFVDTYGCQQNEADSERIRGMLADCGYAMTDTEEGADVIVLNTCAIREHAEQRVFGNVGALVHTKRRHEGQKIFLCGCMMGQDHVVQKIKNSYTHVDGVFNPHHLWRFPELLHHVLTKKKRVFAVEDSAGNIAEGIPVVRSNGLKAWVSIMYGCNNFCSYCIVPYVRGRERSRDPQRILDEVRQLVAEGYKDITLLGQNVNSYGKDLGLDMDFADLLRACNDIPGEFLLRFMTSHPKDATQKLFETMAACEKVAPSLHLPVQAGNDRVLHVMNRKYTREQYLEKIRALKALIPDIVLTSDIIVGFPGETTEEFEDTLSLVEEVGYDSLFTFIYSRREGTPAAKMPDVLTKGEISANFQRLVARQNEISAQKHAAYVGKTLRVLVDGKNTDGKHSLTARTDGGRLVHLDGDESLIGGFYSCKITGSSNWALFGEIVKEG